METRKAKEKKAACEANEYTYLTVAMDTHSALGNEVAAFIIFGFQMKLSRALTPSEKWRINVEKNTLLACMSAAVQKRNAAMFFGVASPLNGGITPAAHVPTNMEAGIRN